MKDEKSDWNRYTYVSWNPIKFSDPTGHRECDDIYHCGDPFPSNPPQSPQSLNNNDPLELVNSNPYYLVYVPWLIFPQNEPCLGKLGCWGGITYANEMVRRNGPTFDKISSVTEGVAGVSGTVLDFYENWSGKSFTPKLGFGLDFAKQLGDDAKNTNLSLLERGSRASVVGIEGFAISAVSSAVGSGLGDLALAASFEPAAGSGNLWLPPIAYWGGFTIGYGVTNVTLSAISDLVNETFIFPLLKH